MSSPIAVESKDPAKRNSPTTGPVDDESTVVLDQAANTCIWNDAEFREGQRVDSEGKVFECTFGRWVEVRQQ